MTREQFDTYWPLVDSVYRKLSGRTVQQNGTVEVQKYECRLRKSGKGGKAPPPRSGDKGAVKKSIGAKMRNPDQCQVRIKVMKHLHRPWDVVIERLDNETHTHPISESFAIALPSHLKEIIYKEASKRYAAADIVNALRGSGTNDGTDRLIEAGGEFVTRKHILNAATKLPRADERAMLRGTTFEEDVYLAQSILTDKKWLHQAFTIKDAQGVERWGMVFALPQRLELLKRRGYLTQFDSTHKCNKWEFNMFSFLVRNEYGQWIPSAHCVVERENSEVLSHAMKVIKAWSRWKPRYVITDDSSIEQLAVRLAFPGLEGGEQEVGHLLCTVHSMRTLKRRFNTIADKPIFNTLRHAMFTFTRFKCIELCEQAILMVAPEDNKTKEYIQRYWMDSAHKWAMYARQHSPLLLQVTTTNSSEAWHRKLKGGGGLKKGATSQHG